MYSNNDDEDDYNDSLYENNDDADDDYSALESIGSILVSRFSTQIFLAMTLKLSSALYYYPIVSKKSKNSGRGLNKGKKTGSLYHKMIAHQKHQCILSGNAILRFTDGLACCKGTQIRFKKIEKRTCSPIGRFSRMYRTYYSARQKVLVFFTIFSLCPYMFGITERGVKLVSISHNQGTLFLPIFLLFVHLLLFFTQP